MNVPRSALYAVGFLVLLIIVALGVWLFQLSAGESGGSSERTGFFGSLFPFGRDSGPLGGGGTADDTLLEPGVVPELRKISEEPVAGGAFVRTPTGLVIRYTERNTGHIYETPVALSTSVRLVNSTVPGVHDSIWLTASSTLMRFLAEDDSIQNFIGRISSTTEDQDLAGDFIKDYVRIAVGPKDTLLGVLETPSGSTIESLSASGANVRSVFTSPLSSWIPHASRGVWYVASAPSGRSLGALYEIQNSSLVRAIPPRAGFQALPERDGVLVAVTGGAQNAVSLAVYDLGNGGMIEAPVGTVVQKCAWAVGRRAELVCGIPRTVLPGLYPDDWLLGIIHTDDDLYRVDTDTGNITRVFNLSESGSGPFDITDMQLSDNGSYALFINRTDQTLWSARLTQATE